MELGRTSFQKEDALSSGIYYRQSICTRSIKNDDENFHYRINQHFLCHLIINSEKPMLIQNFHRQHIDFK
jgi:hypothetical protein